MSGSLQATLRIMRFDGLPSSAAATLGAVLSLGACSSGDGGGGGASLASSGGASGSGSGAVGAGGGMASGSGASGGTSASGGEGSGNAGSGGVSAGGAGGTAGSAGSSGGGAGGEPAFVEPAMLSETGLFSDVVSEALAPGVMEFAPSYELWSDGATKRRWVYLPPGTQIDSYQADFWTYPVGTKLWKEFTRDGVRVETRLIHKYASEAWFMSAFEWNDEGTDALAVPDGHVDARGTEHDIPDRDTCRECHDSMPDRVLGFSALQLSHAGSGVTLDQLIEEQRLNAPPSAPPAVPGGDIERAALGYLHANCGHCHNDGGSSDAFSEVSMVLWLPGAALVQPSDTPTYTTTIGRNTESSSGIAGQRIVPGDFENSVLYQRFVSTDPDLYMPPYGTEITDPTGRQIIEDWISTLE